MLKRVFCVILVFVIFLIHIPSLAITIKPNDVVINLNGNTLILDAKPKIVNERILLPVASLAKELGATTDWISNTKSVVITLHKKYTTQTIYLKIGQASAIVNGMEIELDSKPVIYGGRTFVPLRFVSENLGASVKWNSKTKTVNITYDIPVKEVPPILVPPWELEQYQTTSSAITVIK